MEGLRVGLKGALRASLGEQVAVMVGLCGPDRPVYMAGDPRTPLGSVLGEKQATREAHPPARSYPSRLHSGLEGGRSWWGTRVVYVNAKKRGEIRIHTDFLGFEIWLNRRFILYFYTIYFIYLFICTIYCIQNSSFFISVIRSFNIRFL